MARSQSQRFLYLLGINMSWGDQERGRNYRANSLASIYHAWKNCANFVWTGSPVRDPFMFSQARESKVSYFFTSPETFSSNMQCYVAHVVLLPPPFASLGTTG